MVTICLLAFAGLLIGRYLNVFAVVASTAAVLLLGAVSRIVFSGPSLADVAMAFAYVAALQGGYLLGAFLAHGRS